MSSLIIEHRFRGPPKSGNGGYSCGLLAGVLGGSDCTVTLRKPPPLDQALGLERGIGEARLLSGEELVASAEAGPVEIEVPAPPSLDEALAAETRFTGFCRHVFPACFVCGPERARSDGLRIFPGPLGGADERVAAIWTPDETLADKAGQCQPEFVWAALDCPGYFALEDRCGLALLGRLGVKLLGKVPIGEPAIVTGWPIAGEGRRHIAGTAIHDRHGKLLAAGLATWVTLKVPPV